MAYPSKSMEKVQVVNFLIVVDINLNASVCALTDVDGKLVS